MYGESRIYKTQFKNEQMQYIITKERLGWIQLNTGNGYCSFFVSSC